jgi:hypothetical protein
MASPASSRAHFHKQVADQQTVWQGRYGVIAPLESGRGGSDGDQRLGMVDPASDSSDRGRGGDRGGRLPQLHQVADHALTEL